MKRKWLAIAGLVLASFTHNTFAGSRSFGASGGTGSASVPEVYIFDGFTGSSAYDFDMGVVDAEVTAVEWWGKP